MAKPAFELGFVVATAAALEFCDTHPVDLAILIARHHSGDGGDLCDDDILANMTAIISGGRIFSSYQIGSEKLWIITEADRSSTTIMLPSDY